MTELQDSVDAREIAPNSLEQVDTPRVDTLLKTIRKRRTASTTKTVRSVFSGIMGLAARRRRRPTAANGRSRCLRSP
ncbi:hypothetical protein [Amycolatopsis alkalitolerans]|uniref:Uncharacterized protein n=1 Tax=Amycolatopsis alkalitolerans TaxID=2547244 RepID=A0A5C4LY57_9PSEU|nr:hypothetical protein [Amycolatopsis alkalitolerans]TNC24619.1 hypothetical protein FG385_17615 [Amycolatopsis alkalitolerans]